MKTFTKVVEILGRTLFWITKFQIWLITPTAILTERTILRFISLEDKYGR